MPPVSVHHPDRRHVTPAQPPTAALDVSVWSIATSVLVFLGIPLLLARPAWPARRHWPRLVAVGLLWFGVYNVALNAAEQRVDAGTAAMLVNMGPVLLALLAGLRLDLGAAALAFALSGCASSRPEPEPAPASARVGLAATMQIPANPYGDSLDVAPVCTVTLLSADAENRPTPLNLVLVIALSCCFSSETSTCMFLRSSSE